MWLWREFRVYLWVIKHDENEAFASGVSVANRKCGCGSSFVHIQWLLNIMKIKHLQMEYRWHIANVAVARVSCIFRVSAAVAALQ